MAFLVPKVKAPRRPKLGSSADRGRTKGLAGYRGGRIESDYRPQHYRGAHRSDEPEPRGERNYRGRHEAPEPPRDRLGGYKGRHRAGRGRATPEPAPRAVGRAPSATSRGHMPLGVRVSPSKDRPDQRQATAEEVRAAYEAGWRDRGRSGSAPKGGSYGFRREPQRPEPQHRRTAEPFRTAPARGAARRAPAALPGDAAPRMKRQRRQVREAAELARRTGTGRDFAGGYGGR